MERISTDNLIIIQVGDPVVNHQKKTRWIINSLLMTLITGNNHKNASETRMADTFVNAALSPAHGQGKGKTIRHPADF